MIKILKEGTRQRQTCEFCGCFFSYDAEDIETHQEYIGGARQIVKCPQCGEEIVLSQPREVKK